MRTGRKDRRNEQQVGPCPLRRADFPEVMRGCAVQERPDGPALPAAPYTAMPSVRLPRGGAARTSGEEKHDAGSPGQRADRFEQRPARAIIQTIMAEDHPRSARQPGNRNQQRIVAHPLVRHEPEAGNIAVAGDHRPAYSTGHDRA